MTARTLLAVPITHAARPLAEQVLAARDAGADAVELRVDLIGDPDQVEALLGQPRSLPMILTVRRADEGGGWAGDEASRLALIQRLGLLNPGYVDVEYAAWQRSANIRQKIGLVCDVAAGHHGIDSGAGSGGGGGEPASLQRPRSRLILSHHDLVCTPHDLAEWFARLAATPAALIKVACMAGDAADAWRMLDQLDRWRDRGTIALSMGEAGLLSRLLARQHGGAVTFAALARDAESAPGQPTIGELRTLWGWDRLGATPAVFGLVGWPVGHSLSPRVHNAAMEHLGIDGLYVPMPVAPTFEAFGGLMEALAGGAAAAVRGLSITAPHKEHALRWLQEHQQPASDLALRCGAVNTLTRRSDGGWEGENTDVAGVLAALADAGAGSPRRASVLGAGGAARAAAHALAELGCQVTVYSRSEEPAAELGRQIGRRHAPWSARVDYEGELLVNCTPVGQWPLVEDSPMPAGSLRAGTLVFDTVYHPARTRLIADAEVRSCRTIGGQAMFIGQAAAQFLLWHCRAAPLDVMRRVILGE